jgi:hypothetical protein
MRLIDLSGKKYGRLIVLHREGKDNQGNVMWKCRCDCGEINSVRGYALKNGSATSCGCLASELTKKRSTTHGMTNTPEYNIWVGMIQRCTNSKNKDYKNYGGRGIIVHPDWLSFENFYNDIGKRPTDNHSIDRIDVNGNYGKDNCKWATLEEQATNKRPLGLIKTNTS